MKRLLYTTLLISLLTGTTAVDADELKRCRVAVTKANTQAAKCVGAGLARGLRGKKSDSSYCEERLVARYEKAAKRLRCGEECRSACGAQAENANAVIEQLQETLAFSGFLSTGSFEIVAEGLDSPRGLSCAPEGDSSLVYVAEAGRGGSTENEFYIAADGRPAFLGQSGAVGRVQSDLSYERILTGLPSSAAADQTGGFLDANGPNDVIFLGPGEMAVVMGLASNLSVRETLQTPGAEKLGTLLDASGEIIADLARFEGERNSDGRLIPTGCGLMTFSDDYTSNPFRGRGGDKALIVDPGANAVLAVDDSGQIEVVAADFPDQIQPMPDLSVFFPAGQSLCPPQGPGLPPAGPMPSQSVPTSLACPSEDGIDGCVVGELTGLPFTLGSARIYNLSPGEPEYTIAASGFTTIVDTALDDQGTLFVLEYARGGLPEIFGMTPPQGGLYRIDQGLKTQLDGGKLTAPNGLAVCNGYLYVSDLTQVAGEGRILRMALP